MSARDQHKHRNVPVTPADAGASQPAESNPGAASEATAAPATDELAVLQREVAELRDKNLRLMAESQNQQKRAQRERQEALRFAEAEFARELLVILDDFERTQDAAQAAPDAKTVADGVRIVYDHFLKVLRSHGIAPVDVVGRPFDPTHHEALSQQSSDEYPAGTVMQELGRGYLMHERVLRPARVIVSAGPMADKAGGVPRAQEQV